MRSGDSEGALAWMARAFESSPGKEKELFINATQSMAYNNPSDIAKLAAALPPGIELTAADLARSGEQAAYAGISSLASISNAIHSPDERVKFLVENLGKFPQRRGQGAVGTSADLEILARRISEMGLTGANLEKVNAALEVARQSKGK